MMLRVILLAALALATTVAAKTKVQRRLDDMDYETCSCYCDDANTKLGMWIIEASSMYDPDAEQGYDDEGNSYSWTCIPEDDSDTLIMDDQDTPGDALVFCDYSCIPDEDLN